VFTISIVLPLAARRMSPGLYAEDAHRQAELRDRGGRLDHGGAAAHVALHVLHAQRRLQRDTARVEGDRLADEAERAVSGTGRVVAHDDQLRVLRAGRGNRRERAHALRLDPVAAERLHGERPVREALRVLGERDRRQVVRRAVCEIARAVDMARDGRLPFGELLVLRVEREIDRRAGGVVVLEEAGVVRAVRGSLDDRADVVFARGAPGDRAALAAQRPRGRRGGRTKPVAPE
jgi:hypothetical protein